MQRGGGFSRETFQTDFRFSAVAAI